MDGAYCTGLKEATGSHKPFSSILSTSLHSNQDIFKERCFRKAMSIIKDPQHPGQALFTLFVGLVPGFLLVLFLGFTVVMRSKWGGRT